MLKVAMVELEHCTSFSACVLRSFPKCTLCSTLVLKSCDFRVLTRSEQLRFCSWSCKMRASRAPLVLKGLVCEFEGAENTERCTCPHSVLILKGLLSRATEITDGRKTVIQLPGKTKITRVTSWPGKWPVTPDGKQGFYVGVRKICRARLLPVVEWNYTVSQNHGPVCLRLQKQGTIKQVFVAFLHSQTPTLSPFPGFAHLSHFLGWSFRM